MQHWRFLSQSTSPLPPDSESSQSPPQLFINPARTLKKSSAQSSKAPFPVPSFNSRKIKIRLPPFHKNTSSISSSVDPLRVNFNQNCSLFSTKSCGPDRILKKYSQKFQELDTVAPDPTEAGKLFADVFSELSQQEPTLRPIFERMKQISLLMGRPPQNLAEPGAVMAEPAPIKHGIPKNPMAVLKKTLTSPLLENTKQKLEPFETEATFPAKGSKIRIPSLDLTKVAENGVDRNYNEEFLGKFELFSDSWKRGAECMKTFGLDESKLE